MHQVEFKGYAGRNHPAVKEGKIAERSLVSHTWASAPVTITVEREACQARTDRGELAWFEEIGPEKAVKTHYGEGEA